MENSIYLGLSRQMVLQTDMDIVSNNIANMNTSGYRAQNMLFKEYISHPRGGDEPLSFSYDYGEYKMTNPGSMEQTNNPLNVALNGPGFMAVQLPDGSTAYTRDGNFHRGADGTLLSSGNYPVLGQGGPITLPSDATEISIDEKGNISDQNGSFAQLQISEFNNVQDMKPQGNNAYTTKEQPIAAKKTVAWQGFLEGSNVVPVKEITKMIEILRNFQSTQNILDTENSRLRSAIQKLTQV